MSFFSAGELRGLLIHKVKGEDGNFVVTFLV